MPTFFRHTAPSTTRSPRLAAVFLLTLVALAPAARASAQSPADSRSARVPEVRLVSDTSGTRLQVDGRDFMVKGVNWDYFPVGQTVNYSLWNQPDAVIRTALDREMSMLRAMGVNAIRQYNGVPPRWVRYIYETHGIWTVVNHPFGRYGTTVGGVYTPQTDYSDPRVRASLVKEVTTLVDEFRGTPGMLMWIIGNENNYAFQWRSAATENLPTAQRDTAKARVFYSLVGEAARAIKQRDASRPVALANGELHYLDVIAREARSRARSACSARHGKRSGHDGHDGTKNTKDDVQPVLRARRALVSVVRQALARDGGRYGLLVVLRASA